MKNHFSFIKLAIILIGISMVIFTACKSDSSGEGDEDATKDSVAVTKDFDLPKIDKNMTYKLPSPVELYILIQNEGAKFNEDALNSVEKISGYYTRESKAMNLGIYASDLAYCTVFGKNQETFIYFKSAKQLADELGLTKGFNEAMLTRIDKNINNSDSLYEITTDSYWMATRHLEKIDQTNILPYIIIGGWIESVHIALNSVSDFSTENGVVVRIAEQQLLLENLIDYIRSLEDSEQFKDIMDKLLDLQTSFDLLYDNEDTIITEEQYKEISAKVEAARNEFVS